MSIGDTPSRIRAYAQACGVLNTFRGKQYIPQLTLAAPPPPSRHTQPSIIFAAYEAIYIPSMKPATLPLSNIDGVVLWNGVFCPVNTDNNTLRTADVSVLVPTCSISELCGDLLKKVVLTLPIALASTVILSKCLMTESCSQA